MAHLESRYGILEQRVTKMSAIFNNNGAAVITVSSNVCPVIAGFTSGANQGSGQNSSSLIDLVSYYIVGGASVTGTVTFQELGGDGTWRSLVTPAPITLSAINFNGIFTGPFHGVRLAVTSLAGGNITYAELKATIRF